MDLEAARSQKLFVSLSDVATLTKSPFLAFLCYSISLIRLLKMAAELGLLAARSQDLTLTTLRQLEVWLLVSNDPLILASLQDMHAMRVSDDMVI